MNTNLREALEALAGMMRLVGYRHGERDELLPPDRQPDPETREAMRVLDRYGMLDLGGRDI